MGVRVLSKATAVLLSGILLASCSGEGGTTSDKPEADAGTDTSASASASPEPEPVLGGPFGRREKAPSKPMNDLERPIAAQLRSDVRSQGLRLSYLDCPQWDGKAPQRMTCKAYLNGVTAPVRVRLTRSTTRVNFDAELGNGVLSTAKLVRQLNRDGYNKVDCGNRAAYPAKKGLELICSVDEGGKREYLVATVLNRLGAVSISDY